MPALYPMMSGPENFRPGDCVRKFITERNVSPFCGIVTHIVPATAKVWVQWPTEHSQESPETLIKVNPAIFGLPTVFRDQGYDSYEKQLSERFYGHVPKRILAIDKMAIRIAHTFAVNIIGKVIDDIVACRDRGLKDIQTYNRIYHKYSNVCSDYILRFAIRKIYRSTPNVYEKNG